MDNQAASSDLEQNDDYIYWMGRDLDKPYTL